MATPLPAKANSHNRFVFRSFSLLRIGPCNVSLANAESCHILETELIFYLNGTVDPDLAAYASYSVIENDMVYDKYIGLVPTVLLLEYLSPLPLAPPPSISAPVNGSGTGNDVGTPVLQSTGTGAGRVQVSPWTIGACVATMMGGVISLLVYSRNRQALQRRQLQVLESSSDVSGRQTRNPITI